MHEALMGYHSRVCSQLQVKEFPNFIQIKVLEKPANNPMLTLKQGLLFPSNMLMIEMTM